MIFLALFFDNPVSQLFWVFTGIAIADTIDNLRKWPLSPDKLMFKGNVNVNLPPNKNIKPPPTPKPPPDPIYYIKKGA